MAMVGMVLDTTAIANQKGLASHLDLKSMSESETNPALEMPRKHGRMQQRKVIRNAGESGTVQLQHPEELTEIKSHRDTSNESVKFQIKSPHHEIVRQMSSSPSTPRKKQKAEYQRGKQE